MTIKHKKEFDSDTARSLAEAVRLNPDDGARMREDILKIRDTIFKITVGGDSEGPEGPVMLCGLEVFSAVTDRGGWLRSEKKTKHPDATVTSSVRYREPYNSVPRVVQ